MKLADVAKVNQLSLELKEASEFLKAMHRSKNGDLVILTITAPREGYEYQKTTTSYQMSVTEAEAIKFTNERIRMLQQKLCEFGVEV